MVKCPFCGHEADVSEFKPLLEGRGNSGFIPLRCWNALDAIVHSTTIMALVHGVKTEYVIKIRPRTIR